MSEKSYQMCVSMDENNVIGVDGRIPWNSPRALKRFQGVTYKKIVVMGRKTFESIGKPLSDRTNIVLTRNLSFNPPGVMIAHNLEEVEEKISSLPRNTVVIIGGAEVFSQYLSKVSKIYLTKIHHKFKGDTFFDWNAGASNYRRPMWVQGESEKFAKDKDNTLECTFLELEPYL
jgi:dihydrofolate reductase